MIQTDGNTIWYGSKPDEQTDRTESTEMGEFDLFLDRVGNLRVYRNGELVGEYAPCAAITK